MTVDHPALVAIGVFVVYMVSRGILIVGGRVAGWPELVVVPVSCVLFGLLHGINAFFGQTATGREQRPAVGFLGLATYVLGLAAGFVIVAV